MIPSHWEANCLVAIEALLRGVKLVLSPIPAFTQVYPAEIVANSFSPEAFCAAIRTVRSLSHDQMRDLFAPAVAKFAPAQFAEKFFALVVCVDKRP